MADLRGATCFGKLDMRKGLMALAVEAQEVFTIATLEGLFTPTRVPEDVWNATAYFQGVTTELLVGLNCKVWVDEIVWWGTDRDNLLKTLEKILGRLEDAGLSPLLTSVCSSVLRSRGVERCTQGNRCLKTGSTRRGSTTSARGGAHGRTSTPDQASRVKLGDRGGSMKARAGDCVE